MSLMIAISESFQVLTCVCCLNMILMMENQSRFAFLTLKIKIQKIELNAIQGMMNYFLIIPF